MVRIVATVCKAPGQVARAGVAQVPPGTFPPGLLTERRRGSDQSAWAKHCSTAVGGAPDPAGPFNADPSWHPPPPGGVRAAPRLDRAASPREGNSRGCRPRVGDGVGGLRARRSAMSLTRMPSARSSRIWRSRLSSEQPPPLNLLVFDGLICCRGPPPPPRWACAVKMITFVRGRTREDFLLL